MYSPIILYLIIGLYEKEMSIYTKKGDAGFTSLLNGEIVSKADMRIELIGSIDELSSLIGLAKVLSKGKMKKELFSVQDDLITIMAALADLSSNTYQIHSNRIEEIENKIDKLENSFPRQKGFVLYGGCELSARLDIARAGVRNVERNMVKVNQQYHIDEMIMKYMNRLSDYLYIMARYKDDRSRY